METGRIYISELNNHRISEYTAWGFFVRAWGWDVAPEGTPGDTSSDGLETCGPAEPTAEPVSSLCKSGTPGEGEGQMEFPSGGIAVDASGNVWASDLRNNRVQKFSPEGEFMLMLGGEVNATKTSAGASLEERNICPIDPGDECQAGVPGEAPSQLDETVGDVIAYSAAEEAIVVGDKGRIQFFGLDGAYMKEIAFEGPLTSFSERTVNGLDVDAAGNIYFSLAGVEDVYKVSPAGEPLAPGEPGSSSFEVENPRGVAVDVQGGIYVIDDPSQDDARVLKFSPAGTLLVPTKAEEETEEFFPYVPFLGPVITAIGTNFCTGSEAPGNLYIAFFEFGSIANVDAYGAGPVGCEPPPQRPPTVVDQFASLVGGDEATLRAQINPRFWTDTTYYVEYGTGVCAEGGCPSKAPLAPLTLTNKSVNRPLTTTPIALEGLAPDTTYRFRFVAVSAGGGPVFGIDPDGDGPLEADAVHGLEGSFRTHAAEPPLPCPNDAFRPGPARRLPDCRAYELVSPLDKGNADVAPWVGRNNQLPHMAEIHMSAPTADRFTFSSATAFGDAQAASFASQYLAERGLGGWSSRSLMPPRTESPVGTESLLTNEFQGFSADLCRAWLRHYSVAPLAPGAIAGYANVYRRDNCIEPPAYTTLSPAKPTNRPAQKYFSVRTQGFSMDGSHAIFTANGKLEGTGAPNLPGESDDLLLYEHSPAGLRFVCLLPSGNPVSQPCAAGLPGGTSASQSSTHNAISADGSRIFWTAYSGTLPVGSLPEIPGPIYVRIDGQKTVSVSGSLSSSPAIYWTASDDGSKAVFEFASGPLANQLYEFDVETSTANLIAGGVEGPLGASEDASRIYFASTEDLDGSGPASVGDHNLYLYEAHPAGGTGVYTYVMELAGGDIGGTDVVPAPVDAVPSQRSARVSPDGLHAVFTSEVRPTPGGYDNTDVQGGAPAQEVYLYDAVDRELRCVSCNPTGARPSGQDIGGGFSFWIAARIQGWEANNHAPRVLSDDGTRVFFESHEALGPDDDNGTWDVYQWEEPGKGTCTTERAAYSEVSGGCVNLISSGQGSAKSTFLDADPSGESIFFSTQSSLVGTDYGLNDVYVARVGGGFAEPLPPPDCVAASCQSPPPPPPDVTPASESFRAAPATKPRKCPKGKRRVVRKGRVRCVKKKRRGAKAGNRGPGHRKAGRR